MSTIFWKKRILLLTAAAFLAGGMTVQAAENTGEPEQIKTVVFIPEGPGGMPAADGQTVSSQAPRQQPLMVQVPDMQISSIGLEIVEKAKQYVGEGVVPYISGGRSLAGTDCSGFIHILFGEHEIATEVYPQGIYDAGRKINRSELQPGDLIFFTKNGGASTNHVAIYAGDGMIVHQTNRARNGVFLDPVENMFLDGVTSYYGAVTYLR